MDDRTASCNGYALSGGARRYCHSGEDAPRRPDRHCIASGCLFLPRCLRDDADACSPSGGNGPGNGLLCVCGRAAAGSRGATESYSCLSRVSTNQSGRGRNHGRALSVQSGSCHSGSDRPIAAVVVLVPVIIYAIDGWPASAGLRVPALFDPAGTAMLLAVGVAGAWLFRLLRIANPFFLGPLAASSALAALGFGPFFYPSVILAAAQIVLGVWLGSTFRRDLFQAAGRLVMASILATLALLAMTSGVAVAIAFTLGLDWELMVLSAAPGGVTEMALTAKFLGQDVALITAFHLTRIFIFIPNIPWIIGLIHRYEKQRSKDADRRD
ncbi:MAG: AbrB family transcriptional regulator [Rhizobium sp.]|nr:AbrB family transcriptional regulator [Rhizobium sp.]